MRKEEEYLNDLAEIRTMMERTSKFLSLSGWSGILAGIYALICVSIIHFVWDFHLLQSFSDAAAIAKVWLLGIVILILSIATAAYFSRQSALKKREKAWNATSRKLIQSMAVPLVTGGLLMLVFLIRGPIQMILPVSLLFYGLALFNAGSFTYREVRWMGLAQIVLGLTATWFVNYGLLFWGLGFGVVHIVYGMVMHFKYER